MKLSSQERSQFALERDDYRDLIRHIRSPQQEPRSETLDITCIGNAGGAHNVVHGRPAGGMLLRYAGRNIIVDPGDNSIAYLTSLGLNPYSLTDVVASHAHNDHVGDLSLAISAALKLGVEKKTDSHILVCPSLVNYGVPSATKFGFTVPAYAWEGQVDAIYYKDMQIVRFDGETIVSVDKVFLNDAISISAAPAQHGQVLVTGFVFDTSIGRLGYTGDTEYFPDLANWYEGTDVLWMNMNTLALEAFDDTKPVCLRTTEPIHCHLGYVGVCELIEQVRPSTAIVSHLGAQLLPQRKAIESMLRERFHEIGVSIFCPDNGDCYHFEGTLLQSPAVGKFEP